MIVAVRARMVRARTGTDYQELMIDTLDSTSTCATPLAETASAGLIVKTTLKACSAGSDDNSKKQCYPAGSKC